MNREKFGSSLANLRPVDKQTAIVAFAKGEHQLDLTMTWTVSETPFPVRTPPILQTENLTGKVFGGLVVIGYYGRFNRPNERSNSEKTKKPFWVTRCSCGRYQLLRRSSLMSGNMTECNYCRHIKYLQGKESQ